MHRHKRLIFRSEQRESSFAYGRCCFLISEVLNDALSDLCWLRQHGALMRAATRGRSHSTQ